MTFNKKESNLILEFANNCGRITPTVGDSNLPACYPSTGVEKRCSN
jgi:hypothetical protein